MRKLAALLFIFVCAVSHGQMEKIRQLETFDQKPIRYGFYLGLHNRGYAIKTNNAELSSGAGFHIGVLADVKLNKFISLLTEPGIISSTNTLTFDNKKTQIPATYFHFPLFFKFQTKRLNNVKGFFITGASYNYNFTANKNNNDNGANPRDFSLRKNIILGEIGFGASFFFPFFKFSPSIRGVYGFQNEFNGLGTIAKSSVSELKTRGIFLNLTFQ
ncbi:MAG: porin family protein [Wenyingzhuangia sp.]|jgi:hypothetical protein|uniref:type IX secretion/gliding motility protein PorT/SprT n=1 Tax=Wenyingzhuangia sp. TaxID=1964193 RepID=UPI00321BF5C6